MSNGNNHDAVTAAVLAHDADIEGHAEHIKNEFREGFEFMRRHPKSVTIFGSSQAKPEDEAYKNAAETGRRIATELKYAVVTGGGPGIMEAANKGAYEAGGVSLGLNVSLPHERSTNPYVTQAMKFSYFFSRKAMLMFACECYMFFPGGYGTFDELFNVLTLIQTGKIPRVPIVLFDSKYWDPLKDYLDEFTRAKYHAIDKADLKMFEITDSVDRAIEIAKSASVSEWWRSIN